MPQTLCWDCKNAPEKGCSWAAMFEPVDGWEILETKNGGVCVVNCPEFCRDSYEGGAYRPKKYKEVLYNRRLRAAKMSME